ncbi:MAG: precorrin-8X methylmutase [Actinomycetia bacterium]|nr:precorrin-8X methylmutase [Actinomycetes bacterium]
MTDHPTSATPGSGSYLNQGSDIYRESFRIIRAETSLDRFPDDLEPVVVRMVHASGDPTIADSIAFTPGLARACRDALRAGAAILCDSSMVATGIIRSRLPRENQVVCHIKDPRLAELAQQRGTTKTCAAVDLWAADGLLDQAVVAIGNAPTALFRLLEVCQETGARPAGVVGIPVGFVGAAESKQALVDSDLGLEYLTLLGRRGGSAVTVAAVNAIASSDELTNEHR